MQETAGELVRRLEDNFITGTLHQSKYVDHSMYETLEKTYAYLNSVHTSGEQDALGRDKPFFNIVKAATNIWYRATDIDTRHFKFKALSQSQQINSFLATAKFQQWIKKENFAETLNEQGRVASRHNSSIIKTVENNTGLHVMVMPWNRMIVDPVDFDNNPKIELIELTEGELRQRIETHGYDAEQVKVLAETRRSRETVGKQHKDNRSDYIKLYEVHGLLSKALITGKESDENIFVQQMHVISYVGVKVGRKTEYRDFTLYKGTEEKDPYMIMHLLKEDGRTLAIGPVEDLFTAQWMQNHSQKAIKDTLDIASKLVMQTADAAFLGRNVLDNIETGAILIHNFNMPLTRVDNSKPDITQWQSFGEQWKRLGNEIVGVSDAMLGAQPKAGQAWRTTDAILTENYSLFELMTENRGNAWIRWFREWGLPYFKKQLNTKDEIVATLDAYGIDKLDSQYIKNSARRRLNDTLKEKVLSGQTILPGEQELLLSQFQQDAKENLDSMGESRFYKPSDFDDKTWADVLEGFDFELEVDVTGEMRDTQEALTTLNTALQVIMNPGYAQNKQAQAIVARIIGQTNAMSPLEFQAIPSAINPMQPQGFGGSNVPNVGQAMKEDKQRNV